MAKMNQETKKKILPYVNQILKKYGVKGTLSVKSLCSLERCKMLALNIKEGEIDFLNNYLSNKPEPIDRFVDGTLHFYEDFDPSFADGIHEGIPFIHLRGWRMEQFSGIAKDFLTEIHQAMNIDNEFIDMKTYVDKGIGWQTYINIGNPYRKEYKYTGGE